MIALRLLQESCEILWHVDPAADDVGRIAFHPVAVGRMPAARDQQHEIFRLRRMRPLREFRARRARQDRDRPRSRHQFRRAAAARPESWRAPTGIRGSIAWSSRARPSPWRPPATASELLACRCCSRSGNRDWANADSPPCDTCLAARHPRGLALLTLRRRILVTPVAQTRETELVPGSKPWRSVACGSQPGGQVVFVLTEHRVGVTHRTPHRHGADARQCAAEILLHQAQGAADAAAGGALRIGTQAPERAVEPDVACDRSVDDDRPGRRRPSPPACARCPRVDRGRLRPRRSARAGTRAVLPPWRARWRRTRPVAIAPRGRNLPSTSVARPVRALQDPIHPFGGRRPDRQAVAPEVCEEQVVGAGERVLVDRRPSP